MKTKEFILWEGIIGLVAVTSWELGGYVSKLLMKRKIKKILYNGDENLEDSYNKFVAETCKMPELFICKKEHLDKYPEDRILNICSAAETYQKVVLKRKEG